MSHSQIGALPNDRVADRNTSHAVPRNGRFALIRDADRRDILGGDARLMHGLPHRVKLRLQDFHRVVLDKARARINLRQFPLTHTGHAAQRVEQHGSRAGRSLIQGKDVLANFHFNHNSLSKSTV